MTINKYQVLVYFVYDTNKEGWDFNALKNIQKLLKKSKIALYQYI